MVQGIPGASEGMRVESGGLAKNSQPMQRHDSSFWNGFSCRCLACHGLEMAKKHNECCAGAEGMCPWGSVGARAAAHDGGRWSLLHGRALANTMYPRCCDRAVVADCALIIGQCA